MPPQRLTGLEVEGLTGAIYGEKSQERQAQSNGYRDRSLETRADTVELDIASCAKVPISFPGFLEPRWMAKNALTAVVRPTSFLLMSTLITAVPGVGYDLQLI